MAGDFSIQPARRSLRVEAIMAMAEPFGRATRDPRGAGDGGDDLEKLEIEYAEAPEFWRVLGGSFDPEALRGHDVLDAGCGWGGKAIHTAEHYQPRRVCGFDLPDRRFSAAVPQLEADHRRVQCEFATGYAEQMPYGDAEFDYVIMEDVLEHVADPAAVLRECARVLRPGGQLLARFPSIRMLHAHHFDRAVRLPGLHYMAGFRTWAAGLNYHLEHTPHASYVPFPEVWSPFGRPVTHNLNGMDVAAFRGVITRSPLVVEHLSLAPVSEQRFAGRRRALLPMYRLARKLPLLEEMVNRSIVVIAKRPV